MKRFWWWLLLTLPFHGPLSWVVFAILGGDVALQIIQTVSNVISNLLYIAVYLVGFVLFLAAFLLIPTVIVLAVSDLFTRARRTRALLALLAEAVMVVVERVRR